LDSNLPRAILPLHSRDLSQRTGLPHRSYRPFRWFFLAILVVGTCGCQSVSYYAQAISGQCQILHRQRKIDAVLSDTNAPASLKDKLRLVLDIRAFAERELHLSANGHYRKYADLKRPFAVWNVYAAPELSVEPKSWWYPAVGRLDYRGYFSEAAAGKYGNRLAKDGFDVHVAGVAAYSTLGWFRDPVLNTFIDYAETDLAELLFHELAHQRLFVPGETDFNEAFATAVAEEGLRRWLHSRNDPSAEEKHRAEVQRAEEFVNLVVGTRARLEALFARAPTAGNPASLSEAERESLRAGKRRILEQLRADYAQLKTRWGGRADYDRWFSQSLNNAQLNTIDTYYSLVPAFRALLKNCDGKLDRFFAEVETISKLKKDVRELQLNELRTAGLR